MNKDTESNSYIEVLGEESNIKVNSYFNRYYINENNIFITDYVDKYGNIKYRKVKVKKGEPRLYAEEYVESNIENEN